jgi:hypothetical protein
MLMLQPPGRGSTYRYVLPRMPVRKHIVDVMPPIWGVFWGQLTVYVGQLGSEVTFRSYSPYVILWTCRMALMSPVR